MRVALLAPVDTSLYSYLLAHKINQSENLQLVGAVVRTAWNLKRVRTELVRDGARLIVKVRDKWVLRDQTLQQETGRNLLQLAREMNVRPTGVRALCESARVPCLVVKDHNDAGALSLLRELKPDVIAFTGGGLIRRDLLAIPKLGVLNCHMGLLPRYRGMDVIEWPILETDSPAPPLGLTTHFMDPGIDTGPILMKRPMPLQKGEDFLRYRRRVETEMVLMSYDTMEALAAGKVTPMPQQVSEGRQYFVMHPRIEAMAAKRLEKMYE